MKRVLSMLAVFLITAIAGANARPWLDRSGETHDVYMVQTVERDTDSFGIMALYYDATDETTINDLTNLADSLFEQALVHYANERDLLAAVVRFSPPGSVPEGELPPVLADVRYETTDGDHWQRVNYLEAPVGESTLFPSAPLSEITLSSGEELFLEPVTTIYPGTDSEELSVRALYPFFVIDAENGDRVMAMLWDEVVRPMASVYEANRVSLAIYAEAPESRFHQRTAYAGVFTKNEWEPWPTFEQMSQAAQ